MSKEIKDLIEQQERYEQLILKQGALLQGLARKAMTLANDTKGQKSKEVKEFVTKYGIHYETKT